MTKKFLLAIVVFSGLFIATGVFATTSPKGCITDTMKNGELCSWADGGKSWCGSNTLACTIEPTAACPSNPANGTYAFDCNICGCALTCSSGYTNCSGACVSNCTAGSNCATCDTCTSNSCTSCVAGYDLISGACVSAPLKISNLSNVSGFIKQVVTPSLTLDSLGNLAPTGDLQLTNNKSIALTGVGTTSLWFGNYNGATPFAYGTGDVVSLGIEGDLKANRLCFQDDCRTDWASVSGGAGGWTRTAPYLYPSTITDNVGIGITNPTRLLNVNGSALFGTTVSVSTPTPLNVSFGGTYGSSVAGSVNNLKWDMFTNGSTGNRYGIGMSLNVMEYQAGVNGQHAFFVNQGTEAMRIIASGNVGIGTTVPNDRFSIGNSGSAPAGSANTGHNFTNTYLSTDNYALANYGIVNTLIAAATSSLPAGGTNFWGGTKNVNIWNGDAGAGNVGIGTTAPIDKLQVAGNIRAAQFRTESGSVYYGTTLEVNTLSSTLGGTEAQVLFDGTNKTLSFVSNGVTRQFINSFGNVGIGTTTPAYKLAVVGTSYLNGQITTALSGVGNRCLYVDASGNMSAKTTDCGTATGGDDLGSHIATQNIQLSNYWLSGDGGNEGVFVNAAGSVGIGTTSPAYPLHVYSSANSVVTMIQGVGHTLGLKAATPYAEFFNNSGIRLGWFGYGLNATDLYFSNDVAAKPIYFSTDGYANIRMTILGTSGNVGIGTTAPNDIFSIGNSGSAPAGSSATGHNYTSTYLSSDVYALANYGIVQTLIAAATSSLPAGGTNFWGGTLNSNIWNGAAGAGNVGIGTTTPGSKLTVTGGQIAIQSNSATSNDKMLKFLNSSGLERMSVGYDSTNVGFHINNRSGSSLFYVSESLGNVGIGTTTPAYKLAVVGTSYLNGQITTALSGVGNRCLYVDATGNVSAKTTDCGTATGGDNLGDHTATQNILLGNYWLSGDGGNEGVFVNATGNVGIGTSLPGAYRLNIAGGDIYGAANLALAGTTGITLSGAGADLAFSGTGPNSITTASGVNLALMPGGTGKVGIGTTAPNDIFSIGNAGTAPAGSLNTGHNYASTYLSTDDYALANYGIVKTLIAAATSSMPTGNYLPLTGGTMLGDVNFGAKNITNLNNLTVTKITATTIDPLYNINDVNYSTFAPSIAGGVKEEYVGKADIQRFNAKTREYEYIINFALEDEGSDLWLWHKVVDYNNDNVQVFITPSGKFANVYYVIENNKLIFRSNEAVEISYRLIGKRYDWQNWPTRAHDQAQTGVIVNR
ncbi:MAG: furin-like repeat-containing protein [Patescibacteria group bacterium]